MIDKKQSRRWASTASAMDRASRPRWADAATAASARPGSRSMMDSTNSSSGIISGATPPPAATTSSALSVSRAEPPPWRTTASTASSVSSIPASLATQRTCSSSSFSLSRWNDRCWVRLRIVSRTFCGSVVASTNTTCGGGSSRVLSSAASAPGVSMCTSSRMYTLCLPGVPRLTRSMSSRMSSTLLVLAASSSMTSKLVPASTDLHDSHSQHGSPSSGFSQLRTFARMRADVVLPVPRGPENR